MSTDNRGGLGGNQFKDTLELIERKCALLISGHLLTIGLYILFTILNWHYNLGIGTDKLSNIVVDGKYASLFILLILQLIFLIAFILFNLLLYKMTGPTIAARNKLLHKMTSSVDFESEQDRFEQKNVKTTRPQVNVRFFSPAEKKV